MTFGTQRALIEADYFSELGAQTLEVSPTRLVGAQQLGEVDEQKAHGPKFRLVVSPTAMTA